MGQCYVQIDQHQMNRQITVLKCALCASHMYNAVTELRSGIVLLLVENSNLPINGKLLIYSHFGYAAVVQPARIKSI